ncbi:MAG: hypothetical protein V2I56_17480 [Desulfobacteraceae bacterium]|jgi:hypothetical protein|nr:hypothetical protein [Desulfobacteraceae bacterium]
MPGVSEEMTEIIECGIRSAEKEVAEDLILIFSAFRIPTSVFYGA